MKSFKNWEKRFAGSLEQFFNRFFHYVSVKWEHFIKKGNEKVTLMLIPHNQKKILNVHMSIFSIAFFIIMLSVLFIVFFISISTLASTADQMSHFKLQYLKYRANYEDIVDKVNDIYQRIYKTRAEATNLANFFLGQKNWSKMGIGGPDVEKMKDLDPYEQLAEISNNVDSFYSIFVEWNRRQPYMKDLAENWPSRWPFVDGSGVITSPYGLRRHPVRGDILFHTGLDIASFPGALVCATANGVVKFSGWREGYGIAVVIEHPRGIETLYGHLMISLVRVGQVVKKGQTIGKEGATGQVTGPHLHYEIRLNGHWEDPEKFLHLFLEYF